MNSGTIATDLPGPPGRDRADSVGRRPRVQGRRQDVLRRLHRGRRRTSCRSSATTRRLPSCASARAVIPAPYLARAKWVALERLERARRSRVQTARRTGATTLVTRHSCRRRRRLRSTATARPRASRSGRATRRKRRRQRPIDARRHERPEPCPVHESHLASRRRRCLTSRADRGARAGAAAGAARRLGADEHQSRGRAVSASGLVLAVHARRAGRADGLHGRRAGRHAATAGA